MSGALRTINTAPGDGDQMRITLVERGILEEQEHIRLDPEAQVANGQQKPRGFVARSSVDFFETGGEATLLHLIGQLRQHERVTYADVVAIERSDRGFAQLGQLQPLRDVSGSQREVSEHLGMSHSLLSKCETGDHRVDFMELIQLAKLYKKPIQLLFGSRVAVQS